jgi:putative transcriptional regulator
MVVCALEELLQQRGESLYSLAKRTGIAYTTLWNLKERKSQAITFAILERLCEALECTPVELLRMHPSRSR